MKVVVKKMKYSVILILSVLLLSFIFSSCSKLNEPLPPSVEVTTHKTGILDPDSPDFHGNFVRENNWDLTLQEVLHLKVVLTVILSLQDRKLVILVMVISRIQLVLRLRKIQIKIQLQILQV